MTAKRKKIAMGIAMAVGVLAIVAVGARAYKEDDTVAEELLDRYELPELYPAVAPMATGTPVSGTVNVPIVVYHSVMPYYRSESAYKKAFDVEPRVFEAQLRYLKAHGYVSISFDQLRDRLERNVPLPERPVILSFDDGWENQYRDAFPLLKKYGYTATFFVFTNAIGHRKFMTWGQLRELAAAGMTIGDHTRTHPYLFKITDKGELRKEIGGSKAILEKKLGRTVDVFAYPFGRYNDSIIGVLKEYGFTAARTDGYKGVYNGRGDLFALKTFDAGNDLVRFIAALNGK